MLEPPCLTAPEAIGEVINQRAVHANVRSNERVHPMRLHRLSDVMSDVKCIANRIHSDIPADIGLDACYVGSRKEESPIRGQRGGRCSRGDAPVGPLLVHYRPALPSSVLPLVSRADYGFY